MVFSFNNSKEHGEGSKEGREWAKRYEWFINVINRLVAFTQYHICIDPAFLSACYEAVRTVTSAKKLSTAAETLPNLLNTGFITSVNIS